MKNYFLYLVSDGNIENKSKKNFIFINNYSEEEIYIRGIGEKVTIPNESLYRKKGETNIHYWITKIGKNDKENEIPIFIVKKGKTKDNISSEKKFKEISISKKNKKHKPHLLKSKQLRCLNIIKQMSVCF